MRIKELDALRGLAALSVVFFHYTTQFDKLFGHANGLNWSMPYGDLGVHLFFMISGFVIFLTLDRVEKPFDFVVSRLSRLYPAYWFAIILTTAVVWIYGLKGQEVSTLHTIINFSMLQGIFELPDVDGVYWTLMYELIFYILIFTVYKLGYLKHIAFFIIAVLFLNIINSFTNIIPWKIQLFLLLQYNHLFGAGIIFYLLRRDGNKVIYFATLAFCLVAQWSQGNFISSVIISCFFLFFLLFTYQKLTFIAVKPLVWLGSISYSLYLLHQNIGYVIIREIEALGYSSNLAIIAALCISLFLAHNVMKMIERPSQKWIKEKYQQQCQKHINY
ncbi:MAG: acyltransferase [Colwellia sp.]|nr:acyltransferase [Colwellia sp.]